ncbi:MAG: PD-(D/E)XK nuclease family protein [Planctomycetaceae bacterium]
MEAADDRHRVSTPRFTRCTADYVSFSAISTYQQCPLRYYFRYVAGMEERFISASLVLGGAVHSAAEFHFNEIMIGNSPPAHDTLLDVFWDGWRSCQETAEIQFGRNEDLNSIARTADRIIAAFRASETAKPVGKILGVEEELRCELIPGMPEILGRIDLITETEEALTITDLKTARTRWSTERAERSGEQLMLYAALAKELIPDKPVHLEFAVVTKSARPTL